MITIQFKYFGNKPIESLISKSLNNNIEYLQNSRIDDSPIYTTKNNLMFNEYVRDILNSNDIETLKLLLRKNKLNLLIDYSDKTSDIEFLDFWYRNHKELTLLMPI